LSFELNPVHCLKLLAGFSIDWARASGAKMPRPPPFYCPLVIALVLGFCAMGSLIIKTKQGGYNYIAMDNLPAFESFLRQEEAEKKLLREVDMDAVRESDAFGHIVNNSAPRVAVVIPFIERELDAILESLAIWARLGEACTVPRQGGAGLIFYPGQPLGNSSSHIESRLEAIPSFSSLVAPCFDEIRTVSARLRPEQDTYPSGPSFMFYKLFLDSHIRDEELQGYTHLMWMEGDVFPIRRYWINAIVEEACGSRFWMKGSVFHGRRWDMAMLPDTFQWISHLNGNALYNLRDQRFGKFLQLVVEREPPGDYWRPFDLSMWKVLVDLPYSWPLYQGSINLFQHASFLASGCQFSGAEPVEMLSEDVYLVHDCYQDGGSTAGPKHFKKKYVNGVPTDPDVILWGYEIRPDAQLSVFLVSTEEELDFANVALTSAHLYIKHAVEYVAVVPNQIVEKATRYLPGFVKVIGEPRLDGIDVSDTARQKASVHMSADVHTRGRYVLHLEADTVIFRELLYKDIFLFGKPLIQFSSYGEVPDAFKSWQSTTSEIIKQPVEYEYSLSNQFSNVYPRSSYAALRKQLEEIHKTSLEELMMDRGLFKIPFSIFNIMAAYVNSYQPGLISWDYIGKAVKSSLEIDPMFRVSRTPFLCQAYSSWAEVRGNLNKQELINAMVDTQHRFVVVIIVFVVEQQQHQWK